ncbi:hypothetical protein FRB94_006239 [Tulasnella sp. JGI-2019a]|nr:hypothetical protein FRB94_006239 [Tulasnella sp. JGI-2019a]
MTTLNGNFIIRHKATSYAIGRHLVEDKSLLPKRILSLPQNIEVPKWDIKHNNGHYTMKARGGTVAAINGSVSALLMEEPDARDKWDITAVPQHGDNTYIIELTVESNDDGQGWMLPENEPETQIVSHMLVSTKSIPPQYFPNALFEITPA